MPNTLVHIGINGIFSKSVVRNSELIWIYIGCVIPDFPWITRKIIETVLPSLNGFHLQTYSIVQASLLFSILLSFSLAFFSKNFFRTFLILTIGSLLHLLTDPIQFKWANGVHLFAPFNWNLTNYGLFWPESILNFILTFIGIDFFFINWKSIRNSGKIFSFTLNRIFGFSVFVLVYLSAPFLFVQSIEKADNHFVSTLKNKSQRIGKYVEMDRRKIEYNKNSLSYWIESFDKEKIELISKNDFSSSKLSIQGRFINNNQIKVLNYQENWDIFRDGASYFGLLLILFALITILRNELQNRLVN